MQKEWATIDDLVALGRAPTSPAERGLIALAQLSAFHCIGVSEACMEKGLLVFSGTKSSQGLQWRDVGPWASASGRRLTELRTRHEYRADRLVWCTTRDDMQCGL